MTNFERRLQAEWELLQRLARLNPSRLTDLSVEDRLFRLTLRETSARLARAIPDGPVTVHHLRVIYPTYFPAVPLEVYVDNAFWHPNVHPETGFVCIWEQHRVDHTVEHALHKVVAMVGGRLYNREALHVMQPGALDWIEQWNDGDLTRDRVKPLIGVAHDTFALDRFAADQGIPKRRRRLS
ncbi:ubiquitin-conjugating enzyme E2 [Granulicella sp. S156]|uniref:ubiquitin-conjugating enzyme E2 variant n=1 Tax=Granulicella sp. S156 TaxID=1747224 RepID=UPI00131BB874|nr:ubiquitin-conjugating enzyme E2 [Granulicella sp. S156]